MTKSKRHLRARSPQRNGLILLIVLGMIAMFSLLAVTYVVASSSSILGSRALRVRERNQAFDIRTMQSADKVMRQLIRGSTNIESIFYGNSLLGDVFGPDAIRTNFGPYSTTSAVHLIRTTAALDPEASVNLVKISINKDAELNGPLSPLENEYNSRILTVLEGPLAGNSFRIHKYIGFMHSPSDSNPNHVVAPNIPMIGAMPPPFLTPWNPWTYAVSSAQMQEYINSAQYSVMIDLNEISNYQITGEVVATDGTFQSVNCNVDEWITNHGVQTLFFAKTDGAAASPTNMVGYKFIINDAPFNHAGIGMEDVPGITTINGTNSFGSIDSRGLFLVPRVSPALLTNYSYLHDSTLMRSGGVDGIGTRRTNQSEMRLIGASNEGYDVPDWRDAWLAHQTFVGTVPLITPSFHRPEVINHISHLFGNPSALTADRVTELLKLIQASTGRLMNVRFGTYQTNTRFQANNPNFPKLDLTTWTGTPAEVLSLRTYVGALINGNTTIGTALAPPFWDVDNDGDMVADSVWVDPGLEIVHAPDGRRLKPLMAVLVEDLDSRVNLNVAGDRSHGLVGFETVPQSQDKRQTPGTQLSSGFGYGPAEISLNSLFTDALGRSNNNFLSTSTNMSLFDQRYGARRYPTFPVDLTSTYLDRVPGRRGTSTYSGNDPISQINERVIHAGSDSSRMPGMSLSRRGSVGVEIDVFGNPIFRHPSPTDGNPYQPGHATAPTQQSFLNEVDDDPYEINAMTRSNMDDPLGLEDLEAVLRRFDADNSRLPTRLKTHLAQMPTYTAAANVNREITTRSAELRYPPIAAALKTVKNFGAGNVLAIESGTPSYMRYIQMLHSQRYRTRTADQFQVSGTSLNYADDPELTYAAISELFPVEFSKGLRMDLNRPFGNGFDSATSSVATPGDIDEPFEMQSVEMELHAGPSNTVVSARAGFPDGAQEQSTYGKELPRTQVHLSSGNALQSTTRTMLAGRQILARNLYCLAQLIIPREYDFPGMEDYDYKDASGNIIAANAWPRARIRARNLAQWAVNVVDYRDADSVMTRFEYDILPFGVGTNIESPAAIRPPYWAPDHVLETVNGISNRVYCDVVWGLEYPELLLTESFAYHNKNLRDTSIGSLGSKPGQDDNSADPHLDQFRFMDAGLLLELYNPRSVASINDATFAGTSGGLYRDIGGNRELDLARLAPAPTATTPWGRQPVWRVALSEQYTDANRPEHPQSRLEANELGKYTLQSSFETITGAAGGAPASIGNLTDTTSVERRLGNGLYYQPDHADLVRQDPSATTETTNGVRMPVKFDRFIWFTDVRPGQGSIGTKIPDLDETDADNARRHIYTATSGNATLGGMGYMVVGPKTEIYFGSLQNNKFDGSPFPAELDASNGTTFQFSPTYQRFSLASNQFRAKNLVSRDVNAPFLPNSKQPKSLICKTEAPSEEWEERAGRKVIFNEGVGINISLPTPIDGQNIWLTTNAPTEPVNSDDQEAAGLNRRDETHGFGNVDFMHMDSWVDLANGTGAYPDVPLDRSNPLLSGTADMFRSGSYPNVRAAYLQRLADPMLAYDPVTNPYITVDWISIDLTVFNGETNEELDERDSNAQMAASSFTAAPRDVVFQSRYKTGISHPNNSGARGVTYLSPRTVWRPNNNRFAKQTSLPPTVPIRRAEGGLPEISDPVNPMPYFNYSLGQERRVADFEANAGVSSTTFGYLNSGNFFDAASPTPDDEEIATIAQSTTDAFGPPLANSNPIYRGAGENMANVFWLDRPFANPHEIMMVPRSAPGRLGMEFSRYADLSGSFSNRQSPTYLNSYQVVNTSATANAQPTGPLSTPNDFWNAYDSYWAIPRSSGDWFADWSLILEFVETQPPFMDANKYFRPDVMRNLASPNPANATNIAEWFNARLLHSYIPAEYFGGNHGATSRGPSFLAPFHFNSNYVAAGKINLNTIAFYPQPQPPAPAPPLPNNSRALKALEYLYLNTFDSRIREFGTDSDQFATAFADSRRGYLQSDVIPNNFFGSVVNPEMDPRLPSRFSGAFVPALQAALHPLTPSTAEANAMARNQHSVDSTLLRSQKSSAFAPVTPLPAYTPVPNDPLLLRRPGTPDHVNQSSSFDRLRRVMRLSNLTTNQSNVFAVWVTVGLFEYDPINGFGDEYQTPTGGIQRERRFYIIDRTVPVGFKQGEDLNSRKTILLERTLP